MQPEEGSRLEAFCRQHWTGSGGIRGLCKRANVTPEAVYGWFRGENYPSLGHLTGLAEALGVTRSEIVAAIDGYDPAVAQRAQIAEEVEQAVGPLRQLLRDAGLVPAGTTPAAEPRGVRR
jgi:transcriptional regulator with XRE-family HTH domain